MTGSEHGGTLRPYPHMNKIEWYDRIIFTALVEPTPEDVGQSLSLEIKGKKRKSLRPGDAFYVSKGARHQGYAGSEEPERLISLCCPPEYRPLQVKSIDPKDEPA